MFVILGEQLYGKVDQVPGLLHVATKFGHINFIPVVPMKSFIVLEGTKKGREFAGVGIQLRWKSVLFAWIRSGCVISGAGTALVAVILAGVILFDRRWEFLVVCVATAVAASMFWFLVWLSYRVSRAGPTRALDLARQVNVPPEVVARFFAKRLGAAELESLEQLKRTG